jgi:hypothetical protein
VLKGAWFQRLKPIKCDFPGFKPLLSNVSTRTAYAEELSAQGNELTTLPDEMCDMRRLRRLNVAENNLTSLPAKLGDAMMLTTLWCYSNPDLASLPESLANNLSLKAVWAEGCGLEADALAGLVNAMAAPGKRKNGAATLGLDAAQAVSAGLKLRAAAEGEDVAGAIACDHEFIAIAEMGSGIPGDSSNGSGGCRVQRRGYFKHVRWHAGGPAPLLIVAFGGDPVQAVNPVETHSLKPPGFFQPLHLSQVEKLVSQAFAFSNAPCVPLHFGSAPGLPNWGGLLRKLKKDLIARGRNNVGGAGAAAAVAAAGAGFDVLYVTDTTRSWYHGGGPCTAVESS